MLLQLKSDLKQIPATCTPADANNLHRACILRVQLETCHQFQAKYAVFRARID